MVRGCLSSQRYNFLKANHNLLPLSLSIAPVVYQVKDTIFWKQITTYCILHIATIALFIKSKIQFFESKSQLKQLVYYLTKVVYQVKDTIFWKQITTAQSLCNLTSLLFIKSKIQFFESKSQQQPKKVQKLMSCLSSQRYNFLKANHNCGLVHFKRLQLFIKSKIQFFESKSQLYQNRWDIPKVVYQVKDTIFWKQITTITIYSIGRIRCLSSQRYNFLKANHNPVPLPIKVANVVYQVKDTIFWKQITTETTGLLPNKGCLSSQRYNFLKANHN